MDGLVSSFYRPRQRFPDDQRVQVDAVANFHSHSSFADCESVVSGANLNFMGRRGLMLSDSAVGITSSGAFLSGKRTPRSCGTKGID